MKRLILLLGFVTLVWAPAAAQKSQNIEFGGFGSWWRFDRSFLMTNGFGGGARIGYNLSDRGRLEVIGDHVQTTHLAPPPNNHVSPTTASPPLDRPVNAPTT